MYFNFLQYWWNETATHNKNSFNNLINKLNKPSSIYNVNTCDFLDEDKLKLKLQEIIEQSQKSCIGLVDEKKLTDQIEYIRTETYKLKLSDYVLQSDLSDRVLSNIGKFTGVNKAELKIEELYSYFNFFNSDYFTTLTQQYLDRFIINDSTYNLLVKTDIVKNLKNLNFVHKIGKTDGVNSLSILFKENFISLRNKTDQPYDKEDAKSDFEQSDVIFYPSIKIFCTEKNFNNDTFNRFTYFHEIGHFVTRGGYSIKINNDDICIGTLDGNTCKAYGYSFKIKDHLKNLGHTALIDNIMNCKELNKIHDLFNLHKNSPVFTDIFSDIFALDIIINEMEEAGTTDAQILENIANICMLLGGDAVHFAKELRFALNVFFNPVLKRAYEQEISRLPVDIYIPQKSVEEYLSDLEHTITKLLNLEPTNSNLIDQKNYFTDNIDGFKTYPDFFENAKPIIDYFSALPDTELDNKKDKFIEFLSDLNMFTLKNESAYKNKYITKNNKSIYYEKYLKYKNKYAQLKKQMEK